VTVLVSIPYWRTPELVEKAVRSVLKQTHRDLVCVVVGDGDEPPLSKVRDSRLIVHSYSTNRGAYFAQDVAIWASPHEWYAPIASDDWVDPDHIERLLAYKADTACGALKYHNDHYPDGIVIRKLYEVGIYRTSRFHEIGAHNPAERIGQDSLTIKVMRIVAPVGASDYPTYHRFGRAGSLSTHPDTAKGSKQRTEMRQRNRIIVARCMRLRKPERIRAYRDGLIPKALKDELAEQVNLLRAKL
jgi:glycosyltransferase involved in cell wall biosynthesis